MGMPMAVDVPLDADVEANPAAVPLPPSGNLDSSSRSPRPRCTKAF